jgi:carbon storage regulator
MLVLSRKSGEKLHLGERITLTVLEILGRRVRIGIEAPPEVSIRRGELAHRPNTPAVTEGQKSPGPAAAGDGQAGRGESERASA